MFLMKNGKSLLISAGVVAAALTFSSGYFFPKKSNDSLVKQERVRMIESLNKASSAMTELGQKNFILEEGMLDYSNRYEKAEGKISDLEQRNSELDRVVSVWNSQYEEAQGVISDLKDQYGKAVEQFDNTSNQLARVNQTLAARLDAAGRPDSEVAAETRQTVSGEYDSKIRVIEGELVEAVSSNRVLAVRLGSSDATIRGYLSLASQARDESIRIAEAERVRSEEERNIYKIFSGVKMKFPIAYAKIIRTTNDSVFGRSENVSLGDINIVEYMPQGGASVVDTKAEAESLVKAFGFYNPSSVDPNKFNEMAETHGADAGFARRLEGSSSLYDNFAQFYAASSAARNITNGFSGAFRYVNGDGSEYVVGTVDVIRRLRTGAKK